MNEGKRYCSHCRFFNPIEGGTWVHTMNGHNRRWICTTCITKRQKRSDKIDAKMNGEYDAVKL